MNTSDRLPAPSSERPPGLAVVGYRSWRAALVDPGELEAVAREYGDPVDPAVIAQVDRQVVPVASDGGRARTRRKILVDRVYDSVALRGRILPGLRTGLPCLQS